MFPHIRANSEYYKQQQHLLGFSKYNLHTKKYIFKFQIKCWFLVCKPHTCILKMTADLSMEETELAVG